MLTPPPLANGAAHQTPLPDADSETSPFETPSELMTGGTEAAAPYAENGLTVTALPGSDASRVDNVVGRQVGGSRRTDGPLEIGQAFSSRYHIIKVLGVGGMGAVYQAWDAELGVSVAIKVIRPEIAADPNAAADIERRFKRELLLARQVTHKNVVRIHDLGEIDGIKYITMPYVDGSDLATILRTHAKLPVPRALRLARGVVSGLVSAHEAGVVHRDLKPANIMVGADDEPIIMDFGIARSASRDGQSPKAVANLPPGSVGPAAALLAGATMAGAVIGTVEYMAPEQAKGQDVDHRADIYALGLILYDMLVGGRRSNRDASAIAELQRRMEQAPPAPRTVNPEIPPAIDAIITRCLDPDPAKRFQTTAELHAAFERLDDNGKPLPIIRRVTRRAMAVAAGVVVLLVGGTFYTAQCLSAPPKQRDPVSVLIADFQNRTGDPTFDRTLEPMLKRALEDAGFISAYDRNGLRSTFAVTPPEKMDDVTARELALKQVLGVVLSGQIEKHGDGYRISIKAIETVSGKEIASSRSRASNKDLVLAEATKLVTRVREALGDETSDSTQLFSRSISATSLDVVRHYAAAVEFSANGKYEEAAQSLQNAVELDPNFGIGYVGLAALSRNMFKLQDADKYINEALRHLDSMSDRERYSARGFYYNLTGDYRQCKNEYSQLIDLNAGNVAALNQRAICLSNLRDMREAVGDMRRAVHLVPKRVLYRNNLAVYATYAGDFHSAEQEIGTIQEPNDLSVLALAFAQTGQGRLDEATESYKRLERISARGSSWAASGLGHLALYEGRLSDAARIFEEGAAANLGVKNPDQAARKLTSLAYVHLVHGRMALAVSAAEKALLNSNATPVRFMAARTYTEAGEVAKARTLATDLASEIAAEPQAYGKIIEGGIALKNGDPRQAIKVLNEANAILNTWLGHFDLGRAYLQAGAFTQADSEFDACIQRRGEALSLLADEEPTYGYLPIVYYYQGRVREALQTAAFTDSYREYLKIRGKSTEDPILAEVRRRAGD